MDPNETFDTFVRELGNRVTCDVANEDPDDDDVPNSLFRYLETSRNRAAACEKLILEELEDFPASHPTADAMDFHLSLNQQVACDPEDEENNTSNDSRLLPAPTEAEAVFTLSASVCPNNAEEQKHLVSEEEAEPQKRRCGEMKGEELKRQIERDFQTELKKMMEAEKLHQKELQLMGRRAQEKLDQEWLLQQELMSDLQRRVQEERRMWEEGQKRMKDEEEKRTREEQKIKMEAERKRMEEELRRKKEEERRIEEMKLKKEEERKQEQEEKRRVEREEKRKREEQNKMEKRKLEEEMRIMEEEEKRKREEEIRMMKEEEEKRKQEEMRMMEEEREKRKREEEMRMVEEERENRKREEEIKNIEEAKKKVEKEKRKMEENVRQKNEEREKREEENRKIEEEMRITKEIEERRKQKEKEEEERRKQKEKEEEERRKHKEKEEEDRRKHKEKEEEERRKHKEKEEERRKHKEKEEEERRKHKEKEEEEALKRLHAEMRKRDEKEQSPLSELRKKEEEDRKTKEEARPIEEDEKMKREDERKTKEEEWRRRREEDLRQEDEEGHGKEEAEIKLTEEEEGYKKNRKMSKTKEKKQEEEEEEEKEEEEEAGENKKEVNRKSEEEITLTEEESKKRVMHDREKEGRGASKPKEKTGSHMTSSSTEHAPDPEVGPTSTDPAAGPPSAPGPSEEKRLAWMRDCVRWSGLSLQDRSQQGGPARSRRGPRGSAGSGGLAPLCPEALLRSTRCRSLDEVTSVTLEDLPGCGLSTLARCSRLRSLTLRRCGLRSLEGINQLAQLCHVDVQENDISLVDCDHMSGLRVLLLARNKLASVHGLAGAERLGVLDLSHNSITRIAGLESMRSLQRLSLDHNQLISTRGLGVVHTLLHLSCSHNHLASVEGLESSALLSSLDLRANSLAEPPSLSNQVLLRELHLDDNNISSLQGLAACWLPLMQHVSVAQNRITRLPPMSDFMSLENLDLRFNCMSELQNVCDSLEGCGSLQELHLEGNPLQQERGWRAALQRAAPGLRLLDGQQTDSAPAPPAGRVGPASGGFLALCRAQLQQTVDLQRQHSRELSGASSPLDAVAASCRHLSEALQLAVDQRLAHELGDAAAGRRTADANAERPESGKSAGKLPPVLPSGRSRSLDPSNQHLELQSTAAAAAAVVIQQLWRKYRQKCGNISSLSVAKKGGGGGGEERGRREGGGGDGDGRDGGGDRKSGPSNVGGNVVDPHYAATVIQACWRGVALRRRRSPASALDAEEDDDDAFEFEEVDVDEFVFDEKRWTLSFSEDPPPRRSASEPPLKPPEPSQFFLPPPLVWRPKQAWLPGAQVDSAGPTPETSNRTFDDFRSRSPASPSAPSGLSQRSERILEEWGFTDSNTALLMLKRAQKMKPTQRQKKRSDPSIPAFRSCSSPLARVDCGNRPAQRIRSQTNGGEAEGAEPVTRAAHPDSHSESRHFLPEISADVLSGGRVQLVADPAYTTRPAARPAGEHDRPRRNSSGPSSGELPAPRRVASSPSRRERISHRDGGVQLSGGWGGGKKRGKECK